MPLEIKNLGFNSIRLPVAPQTLTDTDPQGKSPNLKNAESVRIQGAYTALKEVVKACSDAGLYVMLDMHTCSNFVGWRKGRLDGRPPYADATRQDYDYKREEYSCSESGNPSTVTNIHAYNTTKWLADLKKLAGLGAEIGVDNIMGIDIFNEPWDYSWSEWRSLIDQAYAAISPVNPNILIFAQGIGGTNGSQDGTPNTKSVSASWESDHESQLGREPVRSGHPAADHAEKQVGVLAAYLWSGGLSAVDVRRPVPARMRRPRGRCARRKEVQARHQPGEAR